MINSTKQQRLNQLSDSEYLQLKEAIADIEILIPKLSDVDARLFDVAEDYNQKLSPQRQSRVFDERADYKQIAQDFLQAIAKMDAIQPYYPLKNKPLFLELLEDGMDTCSLWGFPTDESNFDQEQVQKLNRCVMHIQYLLRQDDTQKEIKRIRRQQKRQANSIQDYIKGLIYWYSKLEVIRIDLSYQRDVSIRFADVHRHRELMIRYLKEKHLGHAHVGFVWKLEYGLRKSYHLHMMIFMDGSKVQQSITHGKLICEYWNKTVTNGQGTSFNCNGKMNDYRDCGIGTVQYYNEDKINALLRASRYLTKYDPYIEVMLQYESFVELKQGNLDLSKQIANAHVFGKGQLPDIPFKWGRPRSYNSDGEKVLDAILLEHQQDT